MYDKAHAENSSRENSCNGGWFFLGSDQSVADFLFRLRFDLVSGMDRCQENMVQIKERPEGRRRFSFIDLAVAGGPELFIWTACLFGEPPPICLSGSPHANSSPSRNWQIGPKSGLG
jgi:hypothetical protein